MGAVETTMITITADEYAALKNSIDALNRENETLRNDIKRMKNICKDCVKKKAAMEQAKVDAYRDALKIVIRTKK